MLTEANSQGVLYTLPTGGGKTVILSPVAHNHPGPVLVIVHRQELVNQTIDKLIRQGVEPSEIGRLTSTVMDLGRKKVVVAMVQTLRNRLLKHGDQLVRDICHWPGRPLLICDEAHHAVAKTWADCIRAFRVKFPDMALLGVTATSVRSDGKGLNRVGFSRLVNGPTVQKLVEDGSLRKLVCYSLPQVSPEEQEVMVGRPIQEYLKHGNPRQGIVFAASIAHAKLLAKEYRAAGINAIHLDGTHDQQTRDAAMRRFAQGTHRLLVNYNLFSEGLDVPDVAVVIFARSMTSELIIRQAMGRAMRVGTTDTSAGVLLDCSGNLDRLDPDAYYLHSLEDKQTRARPQLDEKPPTEAELQADQETLKREVELQLRQSQYKRFQKLFLEAVDRVRANDGDPFAVVHRWLARKKIQEVPQLVWAVRQVKGNNNAVIKLARDHRLCPGEGDVERMADLLGMTLADVVAIYRLKRAQQVALPPVESEPVAPASEPVKDAVGGTGEAPAVDPDAKAKVDAYISALGDEYVVKKGIAAVEFGSHPDGLNDPGGVTLQGRMHRKAAKVLRAAGLATANVNLRVEGVKWYYTRWVTPDVVAAKAIYSSTGERMTQWLEANAEFAAANAARACHQRFLADGGQGSDSTMNSAVVTWRKKNGLPPLKKGCMKPKGD